MVGQSERNERITIFEKKKKFKVRKNLINTTSEEEEQGKHVLCVGKPP